MRIRLENYFICSCCKNAFSERHITLQYWAQLMKETSMRLKICAQKSISSVLKSITCEFYTSISDAAKLNEMNCDD